MAQILLAVLAGTLTVAAPCILPLLPVLLGTSIGQTSKLRPLFIVLGFVLVFSAAALLLSLLVEHSGISPNIFRRIALAVLTLFGLLLIWPKPFEMMIVRFGSFIPQGPAFNPANRSNLSGLVLGMTLGLVWTPCAGPVLGSILTLIAAQRELTSAGILLASYALGAGLPMLVIAYGGQYVSRRVQILAKYSGLLQRIFGVLIVLLAIAIYFNYDIEIYSIILRHYPSFNVKF